MTKKIKISAVLIFLCVLVSCSSDKTGLPSYSFTYVGTLADSATIKMTVDIECAEENDVSKIKGNLDTIKRALSMTFLRQNTGNLKVKGETKVANSLYKIIPQFSNATCKRITVSEFEIKEQ